jgi:hypothetical protein
VTKFCIDLEDMMLPDAIAAVVEAWLDAHSEEASKEWEDELRNAIKRQFGRGWSIGSRGATKLNPLGKCQLTRIAPDRTRNSVIIPIEWCFANNVEMYNSISSIIQIHQETGDSLQDCVNVHHALLFEPDIKYSNVI